MANRKYNSNQFGGSTSVKSPDQNISYSNYPETQHVLDFPPPPQSTKLKVVNDTSIVSTNHKDKRISEDPRIKRSKGSELNGSRITRQQLLNSRINVKKVRLLFCKMEITKKAY